MKGYTSDMKQVNVWNYHIIEDIIFVFRISYTPEGKLIDVRDINGTRIFPE